MNNKADFKEDKVRSWGEGSEVKSTRCFSRRLEFDAQNSCQVRTAHTAAPEAPTPLDSFMCTYPHINTYI